MLKYPYLCRVDHAQVGEASVDNLYWKRPENITNMPRTAFKLDKNKPGSEVAAEMAAAMAAASLLFRREEIHGVRWNDTAYADSLVEHAKQLYRFAVKYNELYHRYFKCSLCLNLRPAET